MYELANFGYMLLFKKKKYDVLYFHLEKTTNENKAICFIKLERMNDTYTDYI